MVRDEYNPRGASRVAWRAETIYMCSGRRQCHRDSGGHASDSNALQVIELDYSEADQDSTGEEAASTEKQLVYYQLDLGLNHVTRLWSDPISR